MESRLLETQEIKEMHKKREWDYEVDDVKL